MVTTRHCRRDVSSGFTVATTVYNVTYRVSVSVTLRAGIADPEGATIERALPALGFSGVSEVRAGKSFTFSVEADDASEAVDIAQSLAERLLSNPVMEDATVRLIEEV
jgi:phosphoribosylformylglycinamidine synthase